MERPQKITLGQVSAMGIRGLLVYCSDSKCSHNVEISADQWPDHVQFHLEPLFTCQACGIKGAEVRADFECQKRKPKNVQRGPLVGSHARGHAKRVHRRGWHGRVASRIVDLPIWERRSSSLGLFVVASEFSLRPSPSIVPGNDRL